MQMQLKNTNIDHRYFNLTFANNSPTDYVLAKVVQQYDRSILDCPEQYNISIVRFSISSDAIGLVYQPIGTTGGNTNFYVGLSYNGTYYDTPIVLPTILGPDGSTLYQTVYSINDFLDLINQGYATSVAALPGGAPIGVTGTQPLLTYDPATQLYTMNVPGTYGTGGFSSGTGTIGVNMSYALYRKFGSFSVIINDPLLSNNHDVTFNKQWRGDNYTTTAIVYPVSSIGVGTTGTVYMQLKQYAPWASSIEDIDRLIITSASIPAVLEYRAQQLSSQFGSNNANQTLNILTDFFIGQDLAVINNSENFIYTPQVYRITSLQGNTPLTQLDVQILLATTTGDIMPLYLGPGDSIDLKLLFLKKGLTS